MDAQNIGDILHVIILTLILVWLFYHQWLFTKLWNMMRQIVESWPDKSSDLGKKTEKHNKRQDNDFILKG